MRHAARTSRPAPLGLPPSANPAAPGPTPYASAAPFAEDVDYPNQLADFAAATFADPTTIDNTWLPLTPGTQFTYEGMTDEDGTLVPHRSVVTVTDLTKTIQGIRTVVVWDQEIRNGEPAESAIALFGQAEDGDVWQLGQYPEVYEDGRASRRRCGSPA